MTRKIFLDCGTHYGQGIKTFTKKYGIDNQWLIYTWEANPYTYQHFLEIPSKNNAQITAFNRAVSNRDGIITLNVETTTNRQNQTVLHGQGSSTIPLDQGNCGGTFDNQVQVECIDFANWIKIHCQPGDFVVCKIDIEGAEYDVIEHMISTGAINFLSDIYIEWHDRFFRDRDIYLARQRKIVVSLLDAGLKCFEMISKNDCIPITKEMYY